MVKIDIFSGFLGAGKTTLIKKLLKEAYTGEQIVLIENEFGEIGIDGGFLKETGINITEMNSGCICCSLVGDFSTALQQVISEFSPKRILIEPSGVGRLSDVISAVSKINDERISLNSFTTIIDAKRCKMYMKNFGEFYNNQVEYANTIVLSRTQDLPETKLLQVVEMIRTLNQQATIITTPWDELSGSQILDAMERKNSLRDELAMLISEHDRENHHEHEHCHEHEHEHGHEHHHADDVFTSWGRETPKVFRYEQVKSILDKLNDEAAYGLIIRAKGIVESDDGSWIHFDYVPQDQEIRRGAPGITGRICVIGAKLNEARIAELFLGEE